MEDPTSTVLSIGVAGGSIEIEVAGEGTPILLLHGWALDRRVWRHQMEALSARFRVISIDRRGFGRSSAPPSLSREIDDLIVVQQKLRLDRMVLVGMSQGGRVALHFALAHPHCVLGLALQGAPLDGFRPEPRREDAIPLTSYAGLVRDGRLDRMKALWRDHPLMRLSTPAAREEVDALLAAYEGRDLLVEPAPPLDAMAGSLEAVYAPALVVTGEHDTPWRRLVGDALAYGLPNSRRAIVVGGDHLCNVTHPRPFNALLADFVSRIESVTRH